MPYIALPDMPGILGPLAFRPQTAGPLNDLAEALLRGPSSLSRGERELIAAYVSSLNRCQFCQQSHGTAAALQLEGGWEVVDAVITDPDRAEVTPKLRALMLIAGQVQRSGREVTQQAVDAARAEGATDVEIHDTVLIAAAFCMYNRYVDGLGAIAPAARSDYAEMGRRLVDVGYSPAAAPPS